MENKLCFKSFQNVYELFQQKAIMQVLPSLLLPQQELQVKCDLLIIFLNGYCSQMYGCILKGPKHFVDYKYASRTNFMLI